MTPDDFPRFFHAVHGHEPFPWQARLARQVAVDGRWPDLLDVPTGLGKTAVLDVAVFALAARAARDPRQPGLARRTLLVVDRRIVVDAAYERAWRIAEALRTAAPGSLLAEAADALRALRGDAPGVPDPLRVVLLRGGIYRDDTWATDPAQALIACSTVDQVGSRLLFRGYGVGDHARPIHAGLLGMDCHLVLDEAHLSVPFHQTISGLAQIGQHDHRRMTAMVMTATPGEADAGLRIFRLDDADRAHAVIRRRLQASKVATLRRIRVGDDPPTADRAFAEAAAEAAVGHLGDGHGRVVAVVVNRVATARAAFSAVRRRLVARGLEPDGSSVLLTGRSRPVERDRLVARFWDRLRAGRADTPPEGSPLVVVATQCIEAGADIDCDALVSESASLDALRQRFGRLDRLGRRERSTATILHRDRVPEDLGDVDGPAESAEEDDRGDPIYGTALASTWEWLNAQAVTPKRGEPTIDLGIAALGERLATLTPDGLAALLAPKGDAPVLLPAHLDAWVQTSPEPAFQPPVSVFLHGVRPAPADVQLVWRGDLGQDAGTWADTVALLPPLSGEVLALGFHAATRWITERVGKAGPVLRWRGSEHVATGPIPAAEVKPGDTIIIPSSLGGIDAYGWNPESGESATDLAELAWWRQRSTPIVRLRLPAEIADDAVAATGFLALWLEGEPLPDGSAAVTPPAMLAMEDWRTSVETQREELEVESDGQGLWVWTGRSVEGQAGDDFTSEDDASALLAPRRRKAREIPLAAHSGGVETWARRFAGACGLDDRLVETIAFAGWLHDVGKADPRFQAWLVGGDPLAARRLTHPIAKSTRHRSRLAMRRARERSGYPRGGRHEVQSLALLQDDSGFGAICRERGLDADLVLHLVASHHGRCRPLAPVVVDEASVEVRLRHRGSWPELRLSGSNRHGLERLGSGVADRFWRMVRAHGAHRLAWYEAILRLADQRRSQAEQEGTEDDA